MQQYSSPSFPTSFIIDNGKVAFQGRQVVYQAPGDSTYVTSCEYDLRQDGFSRSLPCTSSNWKYSKGIMCPKDGYYPIDTLEMYLNQ